MIAGDFLPWLSATTGFGTGLTRNGFQLGKLDSLTFDGPLILLLGIITVVIGITHVTRSAMPTFIQRSPIATGVVVGLLLVNRWSGIHDAVNAVNQKDASAFASVGYGFWLCAVGAGLAIIGGLVLRSSASADSKARARNRALLVAIVVVLLLIVAAIVAIVFVTPTRQAATATPVRLPPPCTDAALFPLVAQAQPTMQPTDVASLNGPVTAFCAGGWAVLRNFTVQTNSGDGIAIFDQHGAGWQFIMIGDTSAAGPGYNPCSQYPPAALTALGAQLCTP